MGPYLLALPHGNLPGNLTCKFSGAYSETGPRFLRIGLVVAKYTLYRHTPVRLGWLVARLWSHAVVYIV